jgi:O-antigen/teichoic acid export membrane protein
MSLRHKIYNILRRSEKYTKTDMVYLAKGGAWLTAGQVISIISAFLLAVAFANLLPKETFGTYRYVLSIVSILAIPTLGGINTSITQAVAKGYNGSLIPFLKTRIRWGLLGALASIGLSLYYYLNGQETLTISFLIAAIFLPFMDPLNIYGSFLSGKKLFNISSKYSIITKVIATLLMLSVLFFSTNIFLIIFTYFISYTIIRFAFLQITLKKYTFNKEKDQSIITYGKHLSLMGVISGIAQHLDKILVFHYLGAAELAIYSFAITIPEQIKGIFKNIHVLAFPKFAAKTTAEIKKTIYKKMVKLIILATLVTVVYIFMAPFIYQVFFPQYIESVLYSQIFAISIILLPTGLIIIALQSQKAQKTLYKFNTYSPIAQIVILFIFVYFYGLIGLIIARILIRVVNAIISMLLLKQIKPDSIQ